MLKSIEVVQTAGGSTGGGSDPVDPPVTPTVETEATKVNTAVEEAIAELKDADNNDAITVASASAADEAAAKTLVEGWYESATIDSGFTATTVISDFRAATDGTEQEPAGTDGSFTYTITVAAAAAQASKGDAPVETLAVSDGTVTGNVVIKATPYTAGGGSEEPTNTPGEYTLLSSDQTAVFAANNITNYGTAGNLTDKNLQMGTDKFFTAHYSAKSKADGSNKTIDGESLSAPRFNLAGGATTTSNSIEFTTKFPAKVKVYWFPGDANREVGILDSTGKVADQTHEEEADKSVGHVNTLLLDKAGQYFLGGMGSNSYIYKVIVTEEDVAPRPEFADGGDTYQQIQTDANTVAKFTLKDAPTAETVYKLYSDEALNTPAAADVTVSAGTDVAFTLTTGQTEASATYYMTATVGGKTSWAVPVTVKTYRNVNTVSGVTITEETISLTLGGETATPTTTVTGSQGNENIEAYTTAWTVDADAAVTVDGTTGVITAAKVGRATVTVTVTDNVDDTVTFSDTVVVNVSGTGTDTTFESKNLGAAAKGDFADNDEVKYNDYFTIVCDPNTKFDGSTKEWSENASTDLTEAYESGRRLCLGNGKLNFQTEGPADVTIWFAANSADTVATITNGTTPVSTDTTGQTANLPYVQTLSLASQGNYSLTSANYIFKVVVTEREPATTYTVTAASGLTGGTVSVDKTSAAENDTVTVTVTATNGYSIGTVTFTPAGEEAQTITPTSDVYSFAMPAADVTVSATFTKNKTSLAGQDVTVTGMNGGTEDARVPMVGDTLTASVGEVAAANLDFIWTVAGTEKTENKGATYAVTADDMGKVITVKAVAKTGNADYEGETNVKTLDKVKGKTMTVTVTAPANKVYTGSKKGLTVSVRDAEDHGVDATLSYKVNEGEFLSTLADMINVGEYTVTVKATKDGYEDATGSVTFEITKATMEVSATGHTGAYDGENHSITVTVTKPATGTTITYSENGTDYGNDNIQVKNVTNGDKTIYYKVTDPNGNYTEATGTAAINITKADVELGVTVDHNHFTASGGDVTLTISGVPADSTVAPTVTPPENGSIKTAVAKQGDGTYTATVTLPANAGDTAVKSRIAVNWAGDDNHNGDDVNTEEITVDVAGVIALSAVENTESTKKTVTSGQQLVLAVSATATIHVDNADQNVENITYSWKKAGSDTELRTEATYSIASAVVANAGEYTCTVTATYGEGADQKTATKTVTFTATVNKITGVAAPTTADFEASTMTLSGVDDTMEYSLDGGISNWTLVGTGATTANLTGRTVTPDKDIKVRVRATAEAEAGAVQTIDITKAETPVLEAGNGQITITNKANGVTYEIKSGTGNYADATVSNEGVISDLTNDTAYTIRVKAAGTVLASDEATATPAVPKRDLTVVITPAGTARISGDDIITTSGPGGTYLNFTAEAVTFTATPEDGYEIASVTLKVGEAAATPLTANAQGVYTIPAGTDDITLTVTTRSTTPATVYVTSVEVKDAQDGTSKTVTLGNTATDIQLTATLTPSVEGGTPTTGGVDWSVAPAGQNVSVDANGKVTVNPNATAGEYIVTATAKSVKSATDGTHASATYTVTVQAGTVTPPTPGGEVDATMGWHITEDNAVASLPGTGFVKIDTNVKGVDFYLMGGVEYQLNTGNTKGGKYIGSLQGQTNPTKNASATALPTAGTVLRFDATKAGTLTVDYVAQKNALWIVDKPADAAGTALEGFAGSQTAAVNEATQVIETQPGHSYYFWVNSSKIHIQGFTFATKLAEADVPTVALDAAKTAVEGATYTTTYSDTADQAAAKALAKKLATDAITTNANNIFVDIVEDTWTAPADGGNGSYKFKAKLTHAGDTTGVTTTELTMTVVAGKLVTGITVTAAGNATEVMEGKTLQLTAAVTPDDAANKAVEWTSSDESKATVSDTGVVTGVAPTAADAKVKITATAADGSGVKGEIELTVTDDPTTEKYIFNSEDFAAVTEDTALTAANFDAKYPNDIFNLTAGATVNKRPDSSTKAVQIVKGQTGGIDFKVPENTTAKVTMVLSSTSSGNTSDAVVKKAGTVVPNDNNVTTVTNSSPRTTLIWTELPAGTYTLCTDGSNAKDLRVYTITVETTATAPEKVTVTYALAFDEGTPTATAPAAVQVNKGGKVASLPTVTVDGYTFVGWFVGETAFTTDTVVNDNITVTGKFTKDITPGTEKVTVTYALDFDVDPATVPTAPAAVQVNKGGKVASLPTVTVDGYNFVGWFVGETAFTTDTVVNENTTVTGKFTKDTEPELKDIVFTLGNYTGTYDEAAHGITVNVTDPAADATIKYATSKDGTYGETPITRTDAGETVVWVKVTADGYKDSEPKSAKITINKADVELGLTASKTDVQAETAGAATEITLTVTPAGTKATITCDDPSITVAADGKVSLPDKEAVYVFTATYAGDDNHNETTAQETVYVTAHGEVNKTALKEAIKAAQDKLEGVKPANSAEEVAKGEKWATQDAIDTLTGAIETAQGVVDNKDATEQNVADAVATLNTAATAFTPAEGTKTADKTALTKAIEDAQAALDAAEEAEDGSDISTSKTWITGADKADLQAMIDAAKELGDDKTQDEIDAAAEALDDAVKNLIKKGEKSSGYRPSGNGGTANAGTNTTTATKPDGTKVVTETKKDGSVVVNQTKPDGTKVTTTTDPEGAVTGTVTVPNKVDKTVVTVPVADANTGMVAVIVNPDGTEEIIRGTSVEDGEVVFPLEESATIKIVNNAKHFVDIDKHWAEDEVNFVSARELFNGVDTTHFAPDATMTRGMMATVLFRLDGELKSDKTADFSDVKVGDWFSDAVEWASEAGVINGYTDGSFGPNRSITREELVVMVYRYAGNPETDGGNMNGFNDVDDVADWAADAMSWAVKNGIINGKGNGTLDPKGNATRAEVSAVLERFVKLANQ